MASRLAALLLVLAVASSACAALAHGRHHDDLPARTTTNLTRSTVAGGSDDDCAYVMYFKTGSMHEAGTDAVISMQLSSGDWGNSLLVDDLPAWGGLMEKGHDYFEQGSLDAIAGLGPCMVPCWLRLVSDGTGVYPGWFLDTVEVTVTGPGRRGCGQYLFDVKKWLSADVAPYVLEVFVNRCSGNHGAVA